MREQSEYMDAMVFIDQYDQEICKFAGETVRGNWVSLELEPEEHIIGIKANLCDRYLRGIGFFIWKPGFGLPSN